MASAEPDWGVFEGEVCGLAFAAKRDGITNRTRNAGRQFFRLFLLGAWQGPNGSAILVGFIRDSLLPLRFPCTVRTSVDAAVMTRYADPGVRYSRSG
jgi:hypothetical protein